MMAGTSVPAAGMVKVKASARCRYESGGFSRGPGVRGRDGAPRPKNHGSHTVLI